MKISQEAKQFKPITLTLENPAEAEALHGLVKSICYCFAENRDLTAENILMEERKLALKISDAFTEGRVGHN